MVVIGFFFFFQAEDGIRDADVTGVQTCALPICRTGRGGTGGGGTMTAREHAPGGGIDRAELIDRQAVRSASSSVTGMVLLVASEAVFFAAFLGIYAVSYTRARVWPPAGITTPSLAIPTIGVVVLLVSGAAMAQAMRHALRREHKRASTLRWLAAALVSAVVFGVLLVIG